MNYKDDVFEGWLDKDNNIWDYGTSQVNGTDVIDKSTTGVSYYDQFLGTTELDYLREHDNLVGKVVYMTPQEYYDECGSKIFTCGADRLKYERGEIDKKIIEHLKQIIFKYKRKFPMPYISYAEKGQEGLHRMYVIGELFGWTKNRYPVLVINHADEQEAARRAAAKIADKESSYIRQAIKQTLQFSYTSLDELKDQLQYSLDLAFQYYDNVEQPVNFTIDEDDDCYIVKVASGSAEIEKDSIHWVEPKEANVLDDDDLDDLSVEELEAELDEFMKRYFGDDWQKNHQSTYDKLKRASLNEAVDIVRKCAEQARIYIVNKYGHGTNLCGRCIEASEYLVDVLKQRGIDAKTVEGYIVYDNDENCSDRAWDEHTWVELDDGTIVDVTVEQFNPMMDYDYPPILIQRNPHGYVYEKPTFMWLDELTESVVGGGIKLRNDIEKGWSKETCHPAYQSKWTAETPSVGQCAITAMYLHEILGWSIYETFVGRSRHFFNKDVNGFIYDLTADQFLQDIDYNNCRERTFDDLYRSCKLRYEKFKENLEM